MTLKQNSQESKSQNHGFFSKSFCFWGSSRIVKVNHVTAFGPSRGMRQQCAKMSNCHDQKCIDELFPISFSIIFCHVSIKSRFFVTFPSVFFQDAPLTPALSLQKRDQKPSFLPGLESTYYPLKSAYLASLKLRDPRPIFSGKITSLHRKKVMQPRAVTRMKVWIVTWRNPSTFTTSPSKEKTDPNRNESDGSGGNIKNQALIYDYTYD